MIEEHRYCPDILTQTAAVKSALKSVEMEILDRHLRHCVRDAIQSGDNVDDNIRELDRIIKKFIS
jgi:DNA-binding FrmR family transcriptional regulator